MPDIELTAADGHTLGAYLAEPGAPPRGGIVVVQEIFGVNGHIRSICDRLAGQGYAACAPALFDRTEPNFQSGYSPDEIGHARGFVANADWDAFVRDTDAARKAVAGNGAVGVVGFCLGGSVAFLAATRLDGVAAASAFYGGKIRDFAREKPRCPVQMHFGAEDAGIPMDMVKEVRAQRASDCDIFLYAAAGHGFHCDERESFDPAASELAWSRTLELFKSHIG